MEIQNSELLEVSVKMEKHAQDFYIELATHISDPMVKNYLLLMAKDEANHEHEFEVILVKKGDQKYGWEESSALRQLIDQRLKPDLFPQLKGIMSGLTEYEGVQKALEFSLQCEELAIEFYGLLKKFCEDLETQVTLIELESDEKSHLAYIQVLIEHWKK